MRNRISIQQQKILAAGRFELAKTSCAADFKRTLRMVHRGWIKGRASAGVRWYRTTEKGLAILDNHEIMSA